MHYAVYAVQTLHLAYTPQNSVGTSTLIVSPIIAITTHNFIFCHFANNKGSIQRFPDTQIAECLISKELDA